MNTPQAALDDLPDLFSNVETIHIASMVNAEADRLMDLTIDAIRTMEPATGIVTGLAEALRTLLASQSEPMPLAIGLAFRRSDPQPTIVAGSFQRWPRNAAAESRAQALMQAGEAAMAPGQLDRFKGRQQRLRRFPEGLRTGARADQRRLPIDGIEPFRAIFEGDFGNPSPEVRRLAEAMVLLRFCDAVERALAAAPVDAEVTLYVDSAEWPYETGDLDYAPSINRLVTGNGAIVPVA